MSNLPRNLHPLYAITDCQTLQGGALMGAVRDIIQAGCRLVQYRNKTAPYDMRLHEAQALQQLCTETGARLIINDDVSLAQAVGAAGVHLGQGDTDPRTARAQLGKKAIIGITCHDSLDLAAAASEAGADYLAFGRFFTSVTKPEASDAALTLLPRAKQRWPEIPLIAIGGITIDNAQSVRQAGADYLAICHDLFRAENKKHYLQRLLPETTSTMIPQGNPV